MFRLRLSSTWLLTILVYSALQAILFVRAVRWDGVIFGSDDAGVMAFLLLMLFSPAGPLLAAVVTGVESPAGAQLAPGHCPCGYDLTGNTSGVCPECGERI